MTENKAFSLERISRIREALRSARSLGISDPAKRREAVIDAVSAQQKGILGISEDKARDFPSVATRDIRDEREDVIESAIDKYLEIKLGEEDAPIIVECLHSDEPTDGEYGEKAELKDKFEPGTYEISRKIAELTGATLIRAKQSRVKSDSNRRWYNREFVGKVSEFPRSARAALYWGINKVMSTQGRLDEAGILRSPFYRLSIHGMKDNDDFAFAIAGLESASDQEFLESFSDRLEISLNEVGISDPVIIDRNGRYRGLANLADFRRIPSKPEDYQHPAFGKNFNSIQIEIARKYRTPEMQEKVAQAIANAIIKNVKNN